MGLSLFLVWGQTAPALGNPTGGTVVAGSASIANAGSTETINQSTVNAIINWQQFSINSGELTKFIVPSSVSATLNRVTGGNVSAIYGTLESNGQIILINPNGIVVGPNGRIDTASFLGSTLDVSNDEFLAGGNMNFSGSGAGTIDNEGVIHASTGDVYLIANQVTNGGQLTAPQGNVGLAAGTDVLFQQAGDQHLFIQASNPSNPRAVGVTNSGTILAATAELKAAGGNAYALAINNTGHIAATGYRKVNGQVYLVSDGGDITNSGKISARNPNGDGGTVVLNGYGTASNGTVLNSGKLVASGRAKGSTGGTVEMLGNQVGITGSGLVDVSGDAGGGTALIGGDEHGANPDIPDAEQTYLGPDATITADALTYGNGGKIILWGDESTQVYGTISAQGGAQGGNGGFVETSGHYLDVQTTPNLNAPNGHGGTWLLDPYDLTISTGSTTGVSASAPFTFSSSPANLDVSDLQNALDGSNMTVDITTASSSGGGSGNITWESGANLSTDSINNGTLELSGPGEIYFNGVTISGTGKLNLVLNSTTPAADGSTAFGNVVIQDSTIDLGGGDLDIVGVGKAADTTDNTYVDGVNIFDDSSINAQGGNVIISGQVFSTAPAVTGGYFGVFVEDSTVQTTGAGTLGVNGTVGTLVNPLAANTQIEGVGLNFFNDDTTTNVLQTVNGALTVNGTVYATVTQGETPSTSGYEIEGVDARDNTQVEIATGGTGAITITGYTADSTTTDQNIGVSVEEGGSVAASATSGGITIIGTAGNISGTPSQEGSNSNTTGIEIQDGQGMGGGSVKALGSAPVTLTGTGGTDENVSNANFSSNSDGVDLYSSAAETVNIVSTAGGILTITGIGGASPNKSVGVHLGSGNNNSTLGTDEVKSDSGAINITGSVVNAASVATNGDFGTLSGVTIKNTGEVITNTGAITITGTIDETTGTALSAAGVVINNATIQANAVGGTISILGDLSGATTESVGVQSNDIAVGVAVGIDNGTNTGSDTSLISVAGGTSLEGISITGYGGILVDPGSNAKDIPSADGVIVGEGASIQAGGSAPITLTGYGGQDGLSDTTLGSEANGVAVNTDIAETTTTISSASGAISLFGTAGTSANGAIGVNLHAVDGGANSIVTTSGGITINGSMSTTLGANTSNYLVGVNIDGPTTIDTTDGAIGIIGTVLQGTAVALTDDFGDLLVQGGGSVTGVAVTNGALIESTGAGSVSITGTTISTTIDSDTGMLIGSSAEITNTGVYLAGDDTVTEITAAGGLGVTITGASGYVQNSVFGDAIQTPNTDGIRIESGINTEYDVPPPTELEIMTGGTAPITLTGTAGSNLNTVTTSEDDSRGIDIGDGGSNEDNVISAGGAITLTGTGGTSPRDTEGIQIDSEDDGTSSLTSTSGNIALLGYVPNQSGFATDSLVGVDLSGDPGTSVNSTVTAQAGSIYIDGTVTSGSTVKEAGVVIGGGSQVLAEGTGGSVGGGEVPNTAQGDVTIVGDTSLSTAQALSGGVFIDGAGTMVSASGLVADAYGNKGLTITGTSGTINGTNGATINNNDNNNDNDEVSDGLFLDPMTVGIGIVDGATAQTGMSTLMTLNGTGGLNSNTLGSDNNYVDPTTGATSGSYGVAVFSPVTGQTTSVTAGGLLSITGHAGSSPTTGIGVLVGGTENAGNADVSSAGAVTIVGYGGAGNTGDTGAVPNSGVGIFNPGNDISPSEENDEESVPGGNVSLAANGGNLSITGTAGTGGLTGVDGSYYFSTIDDNGAIFPSATASGNLTVTSLSGLIHFVVSTTAQTVAFTSPTATSSTITYADTSNAPLSLSGGSFTVDTLGNQALPLTSATVEDLILNVNGGGDVNLGTVSADDLTVNGATTSNITQTGALDASLLTVTSADAVTLTNAGNDISALGDISHAGTLDIFTDPGLTLTGLISGSAPVLIEENGGDLTLGSGAEITDSGEGNNVNLVTNDYIINDSTLGAGVLQLSGDNYYLYSNDPTGTNLGGIPVDFTQYGATYPAGDLPGGNGALYAVSSSGGGGGGIGTGTGGGDFPPAAVTPQPPPVTTPTNPIDGPPEQPPPFSFTGDGTTTQTGSGAGGLADSSGNGGKVGAGDTVQLNNGEMNNVSNPAAAGALNQALSPFVYETLSNAMQGDFTDNDPPAADSKSKKTADNGNEKILGSGDVVEIGNDGVKNIPLRDAPKPLQTALGNGMMNGLQPGPGSGE